MVGASEQSEGVGTLPQRVRRDFSAVGYDEAMRRAREIVPILRERAQRAEDARMLIRDNEQLLHESGLFRFHQPKAFGGMELDFVAVVDIPAELARGCPSTAWSVGNVACHHWILGYYDPETQREVWDANPDALIASSIALAAGRGRKTADGFIVNGRWPFSSAVDNSEWNMLAGTVYDDDGKTPIDWRLCLVPKSDSTSSTPGTPWAWRPRAARTSRSRNCSCPSGVRCRSCAAAAGASIPALRSTPARCFPSRWWPPPATRWRRRRWVRPKARTGRSSKRWPSGRALIPARGWRISRPCRSRSRARAA